MRVPLWLSRLRGRLVGRRRLPSIVDGVAAESPYEQTLARVAENKMRGIETGWAKVKTRLKGQAEKRFKKDRHARQETERRSEELSKITEPDGEARLSWYGNPIWFYLALGAVMLLDIPLMAAAASVVIPDSDIAAIGIGIGVSGAVAFTAHLVGSNLRKLVERKGSLINTIFAVFFGVVAVALQVAAAVLRLHAAEQLGAHTVSWAVFVMIACIGMGILGAATWLAYERSSTAMRAVRAWRRGTRRVARARRKQQRAETRFDRAMTRYARRHEAMRARAFGIKAALEQHVHEFRRAIEKARNPRRGEREGSIPFPQPPAVTIPDELLTLDDRGLTADGELEPVQLRPARTDPEAFDGVAS